MFVLNEIIDLFAPKTKEKESSNKAAPRENPHKCGERI
jgi:hypothetical protein